MTKPPPPLTHKDAFMMLVEPAYEPTITIAEQLAAAERELKLRLRVYARRVEAKQMTQKLADREIAAMKAIVKTLAGLAETERLI